MDLVACRVRFGGDPDRAGGYARHVEWINGLTTHEAITLARSGHTGTQALLLATNVVLDCANYTIIGPDGSAAAGATTGHYGIYGTSINTVTVKNCRITAFESGIYLQSVHTAAIQDNMSFGNTRHGINHAGSSDYNSILSGDSVYSNGVSGLRMAGPFKQRYDTAQRCHESERVIQSTGGGLPERRKRCRD